MKHGLRIAVLLIVCSVSCGGHGNAGDGTDANGLFGDGNNGGGDGGGPGNSTCLAPGATCVDGPTNNCCSGRCEPVEGKAGDTQCAEVCRGSGAACTKAIDCCALDCNGGKCGGPECGVESDTCKHDSDCCSNICMAGQCQLDPANTMCRGLGETCNSGPQQGCCSMVCDDTQNPPRCDFGSDTCAGPNATCATDADCCHGICNPTGHVCETPCTATAGTCTTDADCCSNTCTNGSCAPPVACTPVGDTCTMAADCCSNQCFAGFCDILQ